MIHTGYLIVMTGIVLLIAGLGIPSLFWPKCNECKRRNWISRTTCASCGVSLPDELDL